jgi:hypothetical protein
LIILRLQCDVHMLEVKNRLSRSELWYYENFKRQSSVPIVDVVYKRTKNIVFWSAFVNIWKMDRHNINCPIASYFVSVYQKIKMFIKRYFPELARCPDIYFSASSSSCLFLLLLAFYWNLFQHKLVTMWSQEPSFSIFRLSQFVPFVILSVPFAHLFVPFVHLRFCFASFLSS